MLVLVCATFDVSVMSLSKYKEQYRGGGGGGGGGREHYDALRSPARIGINKTYYIHSLRALY